MLHLSGSQPPLSRSAAHPLSRPAAHGLRRSGAEWKLVCLVTLLLVASGPGAWAYPRISDQFMTCERSMEEGATIMGSSVISSSDRTIRLRRLGVALECGSAVNPSETLEMYLSDRRDRFLLEITPTSGRFTGREGIAGGECDNSRMSFEDQDSHGVEVVMPASGGVTIRATWATGYTTTRTTSCSYPVSDSSSDTAVPDPNAQVTITGYLVDLFCWEKPNHIGIDGADLANSPEEHTVHCLIDIASCKDSGYAILQKVGSSYDIQYVLDDDGNRMAQQLLEGARDRGISKSYLVTLIGQPTGNTIGAYDGFAVESISDPSYPANADGMVSKQANSDPSTEISDNKAKPVLEWKQVRNGQGGWPCTNYLIPVWRDRWEAAAVWVPVSIFLLAIALWNTVSLGLLHHMTAMLAAWYLFSGFLLGVHCDTWYTWTSVIFFILVLFGLFLFWIKPNIAKPGAPLFDFFHRRIAVASVIGSKDFGLGSINDFANMTWATAFLAVIFLLWVLLAIVDRNEYYTTGNFAAFDKTLAGLRAISHGAIRAWWLAEASGHRFGLMWGLFGIPYDRMITFHKLAGRLAFLLMTIHGIGMLANQDKHGYRLDTKYSWDAINMRWGLVAWVFCVLTAGSALPYVRRKLFEVFHFVHYMSRFLMQIFLVLHAPRWIVPWSAGLVLSYWFDLFLRTYAKKICAAQVVSAKVAVDDGKIKVTRLELQKQNFEGITSWNPGSWIMISFGKPMKSSFLPAGLWHHPYTVASPPSSGKIVLMIRNMEPGSGQWSDQVFDMAQKNVDPSQIEVKFGPPMGRLEIQPNDFSCVILCGGGIGVTPLASILGDIALSHQKLYPKVKNVKLYWSVRSLQMVSAFSEWFEYCAQCKSVKWDLNVYISKASGKNVQFPTIKQSSSFPQDNSMSQQPPLPLITGSIAPPMGMPFGPPGPLQPMMPVMQPVMAGPSYFIQGQHFGSNTPANVKLHQGRPNFSALLKEAASNSGDGEFVGVYACGPPGLMTSVSEGCAASPDGGKLFTHFESFEW